MSNEINQDIIKLDIQAINDDGYTGDRNRELIKVELEEGEKSVLVMGLNPSISIGEYEDPDINFLKWINAPENDKTFKWIEDNKKYTHQTYYKPRYELFKGYSMMWEKEDYLNKYIEKYTLEEEIKEYLYEHRQNSSNYVLFADLLYFKCTNSKPIQDVILKNKKLSDKIFQLFLKQVEYYNPKIVCFGYGSASSFIKKKFKKIGQNVKNVYEQGSTQVDECYYKGVKYVFCTQSIKWKYGKMSGKVLEAYENSIYTYLQDNNMMPSQVQWNDKVEA